MKVVQRYWLPFLNDGESFREVVLEMPKDAKVFSFRQVVSLVGLGELSCRIYILVLMDNECLFVPRRFLIVKEGVRIPDSTVLIGAVTLPDGQDYILFELESYPSGSNGGFKEEIVFGDKEL